MRKELFRTLSLLSLVLTVAPALAADADKGKTLAIAPARNDGPGAPVAGAAEEKEVAAALATLSAAPAGGAKRPWTTAICNPSTWKRLLALDPALAAKGTPSKVMAGGAPMEGRSFLDKPGGIEALFASSGFQKFMKEFSAGKVRAATQKERDLIYAMIPFEIMGKPATVVEKDKSVLYVAVDKGLLWLDVISDYSSAPKAGIVEFGLFRMPDAASAASASRQMSTAAVGAPVLLKSTLKVPALRGTAFGFHFAAIGFPPGPEWQFIVQHPPKGAPGEAKTTRDASPLPVEAADGGISAWALYRFDEDWEVVKGRWTLQIVRGKDVMAEKTFEVLDIADPDRDAKIASNLESACGTELGMFCDSVRAQPKAAARCLRKQEDALRPACRKALDP